MNQKKADEIIRDFEQIYKKFGAFHAIDHAVTELKKVLETVNLCDLSDFLVCDRNQTALYTGLCNHSSKPCNKNWKDENDVHNKGTSVSTTVKAIRNFFKSYEKYTLVFSIGTQNHEGCVFVKKIKRQFHLIHFNPTFSRPITIFSELMGKKALNIKSNAFGYQDPKNNKKGICSFLAWKEIINLIADRNKPFNMTYSLIYDKGPAAFVNNIEDKKPNVEE